ncbi:MAG: sulfatase [Saprospiraceae bacterium]|nr:sulfatase [Lewinella sp.]
MPFKSAFRFSIFVISMLLIPKLMTAQPNILLIFSDDLNTRIGPYMGLDQHTPNLDKLAGQGVRFMRAYCQYPVCGPSRASIMSGLYPETNGVLTNDDQPGSYKKVTPSLQDHPSMAGFFREHGYFTARVSKIFHMGVPGGIERGEPGGDEPDSWDYTFNVMGPETNSPGELELLSPKNKHYGGNFSRMILPDQFQETQTDYIAASQAIAILENRAGKIPEGATNKRRKKPDAPFFLAVGFVRPHVPLVSTESCYEHYPDGDMILPEVKIKEDVPEDALRQRNEGRFGMDEEQQKKVISGYMASVRFMDQQVGRLLETLDRLDLRKNTIVIFLSDHGYNLGEHECWAKLSLWEGSVRVPMILSVPGYEAENGAECQSIVELIDLYPTVTELCGFKEETPEILQGKSLVHLLKEPQRIDEEHAAFTVTYGGKSGSLIYKNLRYTRWGEGTGQGNEELYDHNRDPEEWNNLVKAPQQKAILEDMRKRFDAARMAAEQKR